MAELTHSHALGPLQDHLAPFLSELVGEVARDTLSLLEPPKAVADDVLKALICSPDGQRMAVALCSNPNSPDLVKRGIDRARAAREALGSDLGCVVLQPLTEGHVNELSYVVLPYHEPFPDGRIAWFLARRKLRPAMLGWLCEAARHTARPASPDELSRKFLAPLAHLAAMEPGSDAVRRAAEHTAARIEKGAWVPRHVLMHNDLWRGNLLRADNRFGAVVIDWPGSRTDGYGIFDLLRFADSMKLGPRALRRQIEAHCQALSCEVADARSHLTSALAELSTRLEHFPMVGFVAMADRCLASLDAQEGSPAR